MAESISHELLSRATVFILTGFVEVQKKDKTFGLNAQTSQAQYVLLNILFCTTTKPVSMLVPDSC